MTESNAFTTEQKMLLLHGIDPDAYIGFSDYTNKWYVHAELEVGGDGFLQGITEHATTPAEAMDAYFKRVTGDLGSPEKFLVSRHGGKRKHWLWNGVAFRELAYVAGDYGD